MALAEAEVVPFWYVVEDASLTVTVWPVAVDRVKPVADTVPTVPDEPPVAGPDRALDPPPPDAAPPAAALPGTGLAADVADAVDDVEPDVPRTTESTITAHISAAATAHVIFFDINRRTLVQRACGSISGETDEPGIAPGTGRAARVSWGVVDG
jgi:hypothetical protein